VLIGMIAFCRGRAPARLRSRRCLQFSRGQAIAVRQRLLSDRLAFIVPIAAPCPTRSLASSADAGHRLLRRQRRARLQPARQGVRAARRGYGVAGSLLFFVVVSFVEWLLGDTDYCRAGIVSCYVAALPFLKNWLAGTLVWSAILFGGFELLKQRWSSLTTATA
jgi:hypothetical protein